MKPFERFWSQGKHSRQAHRDLPEGTFEHEVGRDGFDGPASHIYHPRPPTGWTSIEGPLRPRAYNLNQVESVKSPFLAPAVLAGESLKLSFWRTADSMNGLVRNADGDDLIFLHRGALDFYCDFGHLEISQGNYLVIPRGTTWRVETTASIEALLIATIGQRIQAPDRGLLGRHALWDPGVLTTPELNDQFKQQSDQPWTVTVKRRDQLSTVNFPHNPLDAVGWKGDTVPVCLDVRDLLPVTSHRYHLPPSVHATFECDAALVSTFVPRPFETDPTALKVPFFHSNDDIDEVIFYHDGDFFSRDGIESGHLTFHPNGLVHGPHPNALKKMFEQSQSRTDEYAVMIDAREHLEPVEGEATEKLEVSAYADSWRVRV